MASGRPGAGNPMTVLLSPVVLQLAGAVIVGAVFIQSMFLIVSSFRRLATEREQRDLFLNALRHRSETALAESRQEMKRAELSWNGFRKFRVQRKEKEIEGVHSFYLIPHDGKPLPPFLPGQYLTFQLRLPDLQKPIIRCYSLSDSPDRFYYYRVSIKKVPPPPKKPDAPPGLSSSYFNDFLEEGDILDVKAPSGQFVLDATSELPIVLIGGGIGITPVLSMLNALCDSGARREIWFFLGVRNGPEHLMKEHLEELERDNDNLHLHICYSEPLDDDVEGPDYQTKGHVSVDLFKKLLPSNNYTFYTCGPPPMMEAITAGLKEWGVPETDIHHEAFGAATVKKTKTEKPAGEAATMVEVVFDRSGKTLQWDGSAETLLDFAEANGIIIESGCRAGNCGTCVTAVKSGEVSYLTDPGSPPDQGSCLTCISVPKTRLTLDA